MTGRDAEPSVTSQPAPGPDRGQPPWHAALHDFRDPSRGRSAWQLATTLIPYALLWALMIGIEQRGYPHVLTLAVAVVAAAFLVRLFVLFHDCVHGSLFRTKGANTFVGYALGVLVFTPFEDWRFSHLRHHATYANLDARGFGDIWTMTRAEYARSSKALRLAYRLYRSPLVLIGFGALFSFLFHYRLPTGKTSRKEHMSVVLTNLLMAIVAVVAAWLIGWRTYVLIQVPVVWMAGAGGIWLFYVQHQFKGVYWARQGEWDHVRAAMEGSSFYRLPALLRWFSASIGYHHVHHLGPRIPNYRLEECYDALPGLRSKPPLTFWRSLGAAGLKLWDEERKELVGFRPAQPGRRQNGAS